MLFCKGFQSLQLSSLHGHVKIRRVPQQSCEENRLKTAFMGTSESWDPSDGDNLGSQSKGDSTFLQTVASYSQLVVITSVKGSSHLADHSKRRGIFQKAQKNLQ